MPDFDNVFDFTAGTNSAPRSFHVHTLDHDHVDELVNFQVLPQLGWSHPGVFVGRLLAHVSRANPVWRELIGGAPSVVMFMGPSAYITPSWYPGKRQHGKVVPTWNYVTVHAHGVARAMENTGWILDVINRLTDRQESKRSEPWKVSDAPSAYIEKMLRAVMGIEITIDRIEGRLKVSQDEDEQDRRGTFEGLQHSKDASTLVLANLVLRELEESSRRNAGEYLHK